MQLHVTCLPSPRIDGDKILGGVDLESKACVLPRLLKARENSFPVPVPGCVLTLGWKKGKGPSRELAQMFLQVE